MRTRKPLIARLPSGRNIWEVTFFHPLRGRTMRIGLGLNQEDAKKKVSWLNEIFMRPDNWNNPPKHIPEEIRLLWNGESEIRAPKDAIEGLKAAGDLSLYETLYRELEIKYKKVLRELEHWRGKKVREGPCPTLAAALKCWLKLYTGRDSDWTNIVANDLKRFVAHFDPPSDDDTDDAGERMEIDDLSGRERDIDSWLRSLSIGAGRRQQMRRIILRFLDDSGVVIDKKLIAAVGKNEIRKDRGAIRWLSQVEAKAVNKALEAPWSDYFEVQRILGFRPDELVTLKKNDFDQPDFDAVTLSELQHLTLKQGSRRIRVPSALRSLLKRRFEACEFLFPDPATGKPWADVKRYNLFYRKALAAAAKSAGITIKCDCRIGRRTCASLELRAGASIESVAAMLGDDPKTIREHYASILSHELHPGAAAIAAHTEMDAKPPASGPGKP